MAYFAIIHITQVFSIINCTVWILLVCSGSKFGASSSTVLSVILLIYCRFKSTADIANNEQFIARNYTVSRGQWYFIMKRHHLLLLHFTPYFLNCYNKSYTLLIIYPFLTNCVTFLKI
jgi:hypothetical protein